jgi:hypothetical protein
VTYQTYYHNTEVLEPRNSSENLFPNPSLHFIPLSNVLVNKNLLNEFRKDSSTLPALAKGEPRSGD